MNKKQKKNLARILICAAMMVLLHFLPTEGILRFVLYMIPYILIGYDVLKKAWKGIVNRQPFDESLLMAIATIGAIVLALVKDGDYVEAIAVMLFYQIGEWFQSYAVGKSRRNISDLMDIRPEYAAIEQDGELVQVDPDEVQTGSEIVVRPGEKIPIDGIIISGSSTLDTSALTGESLPREASEGDEVVSGCINLSGVLTIRTTKEFGESAVSQILDLVENASSRKSRSENFITRFARVYTPAVVFSAIAFAVIPPLVQHLIHGNPAWGDWIYRALTFLVISCPCALVISIPLSFFAGIGGASHEGVLVKGSNYLETLANTKTVVFDKTGTLTKGVFEVAGVHHNAIETEKILEYAAYTESASSHPISRSILTAYQKQQMRSEAQSGAEKTAGKPAEEKKYQLDRSRVQEIREISGQGITAVVDGHRTAVGNDKLMKSLGIGFIECHHTGTIVHVAVDGAYMGHILISDVEKPTSREAIARLKKNGVRKTVMLTGDGKKVAEQVASSLGVDEVYSSLLPGDKVSKVEELLQGRSARETLAFVGDGINDAPVLSRADIGIAMGAMGSDAAIEAADVVLMDDDPLKIVKAIRIARKCIRIVYQNIWFAIGVKVLCLVLGALGIANMWLAIFADVGVMILAVLNAIRALFVKNL